MPPSTICLHEADQLRQLSSQYNQDASRRFIQMLDIICDSEISDARICLLLHEALLFRTAYPYSPIELKRVEKTLVHLQEQVTHIMGTGAYRQQLLLSGTGLPGTRIICQFSYSITKWLIDRFPENTSYHSASGDATLGASTLHHLFPRIEYGYTTQGKNTLDARIRSLSGKKESLRILLDALEQRIPDEGLRELLFDQLQVFINWELADPAYSRTFLRGRQKEKIFYHKTIRRKAGNTLVFSKRSREQTEIKLTQREKEGLLDISRASLALYTRETETITLAGPAGVRAFDCGRGLIIVLFGIKDERRLSLESYIGYMAFKNKVPVAYGGAWIFGERCKIGLNIYPPFRKGESSFLFSGILRLYQRIYRLQRFVVMPYQFGKGNKEGIESGAFWFYYKLGFRPQDASLRSLADEEWKKNKRSGPDLLKRFTASNLELCFKPRLKKDIDPEKISRRITEMIIREFAGDRQLAIHTCTRELIQKLKIKGPFMQQPWLDQLALLCKLVPSIADWTTWDKMQLRKLPAARNKSDDAYIQQLQQCTALQESLAR